MSAFEAAFARLPESLRAPRQRWFDAFRARGLPSKREEDWRYTDLSSLTQSSFDLADAASPSLPALGVGRTVAFANGHRVESGTDKEIAADAPEAWPAPSSDADSPIVALNAAFASAGLNLDLHARAAPAPLHLVTWFGGQQQRMAHLRHRVHLRAGAHQTIVVHELGDDAAFFATQVFDLLLAENAQLDLYRIQSPGRGTSLLTRMDVRVGRDSRFNCVAFHGGGALVRNDINVSLDAPGAQAQLDGVLAPAGAEHLDVHTRLDHRAPHGRSREAFRVIVQDKARAVFNGKVVVHPDAQKTDSEQHVDSLLLSPGAEVNAKPELEIYADDVKCAHGATCGQLDEQAVHYLRTRGIGRELARNLLLFTFARRILSGMASEPARRLAEQALLARLPGADALAELL